MFNSVRTKLTLWYSLILALVLICFAAGTYFLLAQMIAAQTDASLRDNADAFVKTLAVEGEGENDETNESVLTDITREFHFQDRIFFLLDERQNLIAASENPNRMRLNLLQKEVFRPDGFQNITEKHNGDYRIFSRSVEFRGQNYHLMIAALLDKQNQLLSQTRLIFLFAVPVALLTAGFGGYYLARKSLAPVVEMSEKAALIGSTNLNERLPIANEKDELGELATTFNQLLSRLEAAFEQQRRFMADASHELRTPLAIVRGEADVALRKDSRSETEYRESLEIVREEGKRLTRIVEDLFTLARADAGQYALHKTEFYLDELLAECARAVRTLTAEKNLKFDLKTENGLIFHGDEILIRRLTMNLFDNAIKYTPPNGEISVTCYNVKDEYEIQISNSGEIIPPEAQEHIFERFYRTDKARSRTGNDKFGTGAGLGLAIARYITQAHHGLIALQKSDTTETVFLIKFPTGK